MELDRKRMEKCPARAQLGSSSLSLKPDFGLILFWTLPVCVCHLMVPIEGRLSLSICRSISTEQREGSARRIGQTKGGV